MTNSISFFCWEKDEKLEIQLEPEALLFEVLPGDEITFKATFLSNEDIRWGVRFERKYQSIHQSIQLFLRQELTTLEIFENGVLLDDWYKYMRPH